MIKSNKLIPTAPSPKPNSSQREMIMQSFDKKPEENVASLNVLQHNSFCEMRLKKRRSIKVQLTRMMLDKLNLSKYRL